MAPDAPSRPATARSAEGDLVSVVMANHRGADHLAAAMRSVLAQSHPRLELLVCDDASDDDSVTIARGLTAGDPRVEVLKAGVNGGPARARNAGLARARGEWIAIVDSDDLLHPERIARLLAAAVRHRADMVADDLVPFGPGRVGPARTMFSDRFAGPSVVRIDPQTLLGGGPAGRDGAALGYLKPLVVRRVLRDMRYDETLRNGEDFDLYLRLVLRGARFVLTPAPTYLYRRHAGSISHRLTDGVLGPLLTAHEAIAASVDNGSLVRALGTRGRSLRRALRYARLVRAIKARSLGSAAAMLTLHPALWSDLLESLRDRRRAADRPSVGTGAPRLVILGPSGCPGLVDFPDAEVIGFAPGDAPDDLAADGPGAARLCAIWGSGPPDVVAVGAAGRRAVGYLPSWSSLEYRSED